MHHRTQGHVTLLAPEAAFSRRAPKPAVDTDPQVDVIVSTALPPSLVSVSTEQGEGGESWFNCVRFLPVPVRNPELGEERLQ